MTLLLGLVILGLVLAMGYGGWMVRRHILLPLARLRQLLLAAGVTPDSSPSSTLHVAAAYLRDLTTRARQAEADRALLHSVLTRTQDGIIVVDDDLRILLANEAASRIFARPGMSLEGRRIPEIVREKQLYDGFHQALQQRQPNEGRLEKVESLEHRVFQWRTLPLGEGKAAGVFLDVTRLEQLERARQEFLANVSHELRTPLTAILAYVETLLDGAIYDSDNNIRFLETIQKHARRLSHLVNDIADLSAIESGHVHLEPVALGLHQLVAEVLDTVRPRTRQLDITLLNEVPPDLQLIADRERFEQILLNLVDNAVKFNRRGGHVRVQAVRQDGAIVVSVRDTGIGIPASDLPRIFERFYRVDKGRSVELGGTGLGLAIVKHLVRLHGGTITVESQLGEGSCFHIIWPDVAAETKGETGQWTQEQRGEAISSPLTLPSLCSSSLDAD